MNGTVIGAEALGRRLRGMAKELERPLRGAVRESAEQVREAAIAAMRGPKSGRVYRAPGGGSRRASAPGEAPAVSSGRLVGSLRISTGDDGLTASVGVDETAAPHARALEFGTSRMAARPFLAPALEASRGDIERRIRDALRRAVRDAGRGTRG